MKFEIKSVMQLIYDLGVAEGILSAVRTEDPGATAYAAMPYIRQTSCFLQKIVFEQHLEALGGGSSDLISADDDHE